jgi:hypothetical protein
MIDAPAVRAGECPTCHAPLLADQRYCVYCGTRAPQTRLEFLDALRADGVIAPRTQVVAAPTGADRWGVPLLAVVAALGVGALLGHWATAQPKAAAAPATQVIRVSGDGGSAAPAAPTAVPSATATPTVAATATPQASDKPAATATPTKDLSKDSIKKAVKDKAPISTGGTPPPKDDKPAGNGSGFETIG